MNAVLKWCTLVRMEVKIRVWLGLMMPPHCQPPLKFEIGVVHSTGVIRAVRSTIAIRVVRSTGVTLKRDVTPATNLKAYVYTERQAQSNRTKHIVINTQRV